MPKIHTQALSLEWIQKQTTVSTWSDLKFITCLVKSLSPLNNLCFQDTMEGYPPILDSDQTQKNYVFVLSLAGWEWWCYCCYKDHSEMQTHPPQAEVVEDPVEEDKLMLLLHMFLLSFKTQEKSKPFMSNISWSWTKFQYKISCSAVEVSVLLGCSATSLGDQCQTF